MENGRTAAERRCSNQAGWTRRSEETAEEEMEMGMRWMDGENKLLLLLLLLLLLVRMRFRKRRGVCAWLTWRSKTQLEVDAWRRKGKIGPLARM